MKTMYTLLVIQLICFTGCLSNPSPLENVEDRIVAAVRETGLNTLNVGPLDDSVPMIRRVTVTGSHRDLGFIEGTVAREAGIPLPLVQEEERQRNTKIIDFYRAVYPPHLEKVRGTAEAYGMTLEDVSLEAMERGFYDRFGTEGYDAETTAGSGFPKNVGSCSVIGISVTDESDTIPLVGRNLDTYNITGFLVHSRMDGVYASVAMSGESFHDYVVDGINEKGLFIGEMSILDPDYTRANLSREYPEKPSVYMMRMMRIVLDTCATVEEAVSLFERVPVWFTHDLWHFFLADSSGSRCVIEYTKDGAVAVVQGSGDYLLSTNTPLVEDRAVLLHCPRWLVAEKALSGGKVLTKDDLVRLMGVISVSRRNPWLEQVVPISYLDTLRTVWTTVYNLRDRTMELYHWQDGYVCREFSVPD